MSDNRDYHGNRDYHLYEIDRNNPWSFNETCFVNNFAKQVGHFACFTVFQRGQRVVEGTEGRREGQRAIEGTEGRRGNRGL